MTLSLRGQGGGGGGEGGVHLYTVYILYRYVLHHRVCSSEPRSETGYFSFLLIIKFQV